MHRCVSKFAVQYDRADMIFMQQPTKSKATSKSLKMKHLLQGLDTFYARVSTDITHLGRNAHEFLGVHVPLSLLGLFDIGEGGRNDDGLAIVGEALQVVNKRNAGLTKEMIVSKFG